MATLANAPRPVEVGGRSFRVSALTQREWAAHQAWIKDFVPRPEPPDGLDRVEAALFRRAWPPAIGSKLWWDALDHDGCFPAFIQILMGKHRPGGMSDEEAMVVAMQAVDEKVVGTLALRAMGLDPGPEGLKLVGDDGAGKDEAEPGDGATGGDRPESDDPGTVYYSIAKVFGWSHRDVMELTFSQLKYYCHAGKPPARGERRHSSTVSARGG